MKRTTRWVLVRVGMIDDEVGVAELIRDNTLEAFEEHNPATLDYILCNGSPLTKGGMGGYTWCHDCETWGIPMPFERIASHDDFDCGNCSSENVTHYEALYERRNGKQEIDARPAFLVLENEIRRLQDMIDSCCERRRKEGQTVVHCDSYGCSTLEKVIDHLEEVQKGFTGRLCALG